MSQDKRIHFIGVGGIGVSALAQWYHHEGWYVSGSDSTKSLITDDLKKRGLKIYIGDDNSQVITEKTDLVVYSNAVPLDHPERVKAGDLEIKELNYPRALAQLTKKKKTIAICGTHGKSTTTAMTALILMQAGFDPTVIIGTRIPQLKNNNFRYGKSEWLIIEADEYKEAFLSYSPYAIIATNVEADHLDYYRNYSRVKDAFQKFFSRLIKGGYLIANTDDGFLRKVRAGAGKHLKKFNLDHKRAKEIKRILKVPGRHNLYNALGADTLAAELGITKKVRDKALSSFKGTWRRFEFKGTFRGAKVYDDYAHHPTELKAILQGTRELYPDKVIWCVHQPHHTSRLQNFFDDFVSAFADADNVIILETYKVKGRENEKEDPDKTARALAARIVERQPAVYAQNPEGVISILKGVVEKGDIVLITGAGDITEIADKLVKAG